MTFLRPGPHITLFQRLPHRQKVMGWAWKGKLGIEPIATYRAGTAMAVPHWKSLKHSCQGISLNCVSGQEEHSVNQKKNHVHQNNIPSVFVHFK